MKMIYKSEMEIAKNGSIVPVFSNGKLVHSKYNPQSECSRMSGVKGLFSVVIGLGGGYHIEAIHRANPEMMIVVVEENSVDFEFLSAIPCVKELCNSDKIIFCGKENIAKILLSSYIPVFHGDMNIISLHSWAANFPDLDAEIRLIISATLKNISADFSVQAHFGRHWHRNILMNLKSAAVFAPTVLPRVDGRTAAVVAAGPTLDFSVRILKENREKYFVIATDTAFTALSRFGISADAVVSIDAQNVSFRHFLHFPEKNPPICVFDLGSPHSSVAQAARHGASVIFASSAHPLEMLSRQFGSFPILESGAGTVTIAASDFARLCGFSRIELFGADFSYSHGKPYAKGTYLDDIFAFDSSRISNAESAFCTLMFRTELKSENGVFTTEMLKKYSATTDDFFSSHGFFKDVSSAEKKVFCASKTVSAPKNAQKNTAKKFDFANFRDFLLSETEKLLSDKDIKKHREAFFAHLPAIAAISQKKNLPFFALLKLAYEASVRYTV